MAQRVDLELHTDEEMISATNPNSPYQPCEVRVVRDRRERHFEEMCVRALKNKFVQVLIAIFMVSMVTSLIYLAAIACGAQKSCDRESSTVVQSVIAAETTTTTSTTEPTTTTTTETTTTEEPETTTTTTTTAKPKKGSGRTVYRLDLSNYTTTVSTTTASDSANITNVTTTVSDADNSASVSEIEQVTEADSTTSEPKTTSDDSTTTTTTRKSLLDDTFDLFFDKE